MKKTAAPTRGPPRPAGQKNWSIFIPSHTPIPQPFLGLRSLLIPQIASSALPSYTFDIKPLYPPLLMSLARPLSQIPIFGSRIMNEYQRKAQSTLVHFDNETTRRELGVEFRSLETTVKEGIESIVEKGFAEFKHK